MLKRKLIKQGNNALTVTLPARWLQQHKLKAGQEVHITEKHKELSISSQVHSNTESTITYDITGMDRTSFLKLFTAIYESGYDEVRLTFQHEDMHDHKLSKKVKTAEQISKYIKRFEGFAVIGQGPGYYHIKDISTPASDAFDAVQRRIFFLLLDFHAMIERCLTSGNFSELSTHAERHDNITKFVSFCLRLLNKKMISDVEKYNTHRIITTLDLITDYERYLSEDLTSLKKINAQTSTFLLRIMESLSLFYRAYYTPTNEALEQVVKRNFEVKTLDLSSLPPVEAHMVNKYSTTTRLLFSLLSSVQSLRLVNQTL